MTMRTTSRRTRKAVTPSNADTRLARRASQAISHIAEETSETEPVHLRIVRDTEQNPIDLIISGPTLQLIAQILTEIGKGNAVSVHATEQEVTPQQAARLLGVSRPFFLHLLEKEKIPFRYVGAHRRIRLNDVLAFRREQERRERVMQELMAETESLGLH